MVVSSDSEAMGVPDGVAVEVRVVCSQSRCEVGGMPVMGKSLVFRWAMLQVGVMRRSEEEEGERIWREMSGGGLRDDILGLGGGDDGREGELEVKDEDEDGRVEVDDRTSV